MPSSSRFILDTPVDFPLASVLETPLDVLTFYDEQVQTGVLKLYDWQSDILKEFGRSRLSLEDVVKIMLKCNNGAGKSQIIIAPCAIWLSLKFQLAMTAITVSSGYQLDNQVGSFVKRLASRVNAVHRDELDGADVFDVRYRDLKCNVTHSETKLFATDEAGKAEGFHQLKVGGEFAIIVDEAKSVEDPIFEALDKMRDCTRRLDASSPGPTSGNFYNTWTNEKLEIYRKQVTAFQCPHVTKKSIADSIAKYGHNHPHIRSSIFAEFTNSDADVVISREVLVACTKTCDKVHYFNQGKLRAGLDLSWSLGGDECVLSIWKGNEEIALHTWKHEDTTRSVDEIVKLVDLYHGKLAYDDICVDDGGAGGGIIDMLNRLGYKMNRVLNNTRAYDITRYGNMGTENWYNFKRFVEEGQIKFKLDEVTGAMDSITFKQLSERYRRNQINTGKIILEPKKEAKSKGHPSPDRADAMVLAWCRVQFPLEELTEALTSSVVKPKEIFNAAEYENKLLMREISDIMGAMNNKTSDANVNPRTGTYRISTNFGFRLSNLIGSK